MFCARCQSLVHAAGAVALQVEGDVGKTGRFALGNDALSVIHDQIELLRQHLDAGQISVDAHARLSYAQIDQELLGAAGDVADDVETDKMDDFLAMLEAYTAQLETEEAEAQEQVPMTLEELRDMLVDVRAKLDSYSWLQHLFLYEIKPGQVNTLRDTGLNDVTVLDEDHSPALFEMVQAVEDAENAEDEEITE